MCIDFIESKEIHGQFAVGDFCDCTDNSMKFMGGNLPRNFVAILQ
jgi:hypothetical protein